MDTLTTKVWRLWHAIHTEEPDESTPAFTTPNVMFVALAVARRSYESGQCWAKQKTIADDIGLSTKTIARCLAELEGAGWVKRVGRQRPDGGRTSDLIWLTLPDVLLKADVVGRKRPDPDGPADDQEADTVGNRADSESRGVPTPVERPPVTESEQNRLKGNNKKDSEGGLSPAARGEEPSAEEVGLAVASIWQAASKRGRERSSQNDIAAGLRAALKRGHPMEKIMRGLGGYFRTEDATKDDGAFQRGAHTILAKDRFLSFLDDEAARPLGLTPADDAKVTRFGTPEAPTQETQRMWMTLHRQGQLWDAEIRGPAPGAEGCRVEPIIQEEFGVVPFGDHTPADEADGDDAAAFD